MGSDPSLTPPSVPRPVVVAHGLWMPGAETIVLRRRLAAAGFAPHAFKYHTVHASLAQSAAELDAFVDALDAPAVDLVGYSLGAIVVLTMLERLRPDHDGRVVSLGPPFKGSLAAERLARLPGGKRMIGPGLLEHAARGGFAAWHGRQPLGIIAGSLDWSFARLLGRLPGPNDGTVTVDETRLPGAADHIVVRATHTTLMFSRRVAAETVQFLRHGAFTHGMP